MKNTFIPLSIAFIAADGRILNIDDMAPQDETLHWSRGPGAVRARDAQGLVRRARHQGRRSGVGPAAAEALTRRSLPRVAHADADPVAPDAGPRRPVAVPAAAAARADRGRRARRRPGAGGAGDRPQAGVRRLHVCDGELPPAARTTTSASTYFTTLPREWVVRYDQQAYVECDPRVLYSFESALPARLGPGQRARQESAKTDAFLADAAAHGVASGVAFPVYAGYPARTLVSLSYARSR